MVDAISSKLDDKQKAEAKKILDEMKSTKASEAKAKPAAAPVAPKKAK